MFVYPGLPIGLQYSFGVLFDVLLEAFGGSRAATAWVGGLSVGVLEIAAVLCGVLTARTSARFCAVVGNAVSLVGLLLSSCATELWHLFLTFGRRV